MIDLFSVAAQEAVSYLNSVQLDEQMIQAYKNHHERMVGSTLIWMEYADKGVTRQDDEKVMELTLYIRNHSPITEASALRSILRDLIKVYGIRAWSDAGRNVSTGVTTLTLRIEGDAGKIAIALGMLSNQVCGSMVSA